MKNILYIFIACMFALNISCKDHTGSLLNVEASRLSFKDLPENPLLLHPVTLWNKPKDGNMSVIYANDLAWQEIKSSNRHGFPEKASLYQVTWAVENDKEWFGALTPKRIVRIEQIQFLKDFNYQYRQYLNENLGENSGAEKENSAELILEKLKNTAE